MLHAYACLTSKNTYISPSPEAKQTRPPWAARCLGEPQVMGGEMRGGWRCLHTQTLHVTGILADVWVFEKGPMGRHMFQAHGVFWDMFYPPARAVQVPNQSLLSGAAG